MAIRINVSSGETPAVRLGVSQNDFTLSREAEAWAVGTRNGVAVSEGDPAYHNNAKYYANNAQPIDDTAWVGDTGKVWSANKSATEVINVKSAIEYFGIEPIPLTNGKYYDLSGTSVTMENGVPKFASGTSVYSGGYLACQAGDRFTISGTGGSATRLWAFVAADGTILLRSISSNTLNNKIIIAPAGSAFIIVHTRYGEKSYKGVTYERCDKLAGDPLNVFDPDYFCANDKSYVNSPVITKTGAYLESETGANKSSSVYLTLKPQTEYIFRAKKHTTSGSGYIRANESNDGGKTYSALSSALVFMSSSDSDDLIYSTEFTTTTGALRIIFFLTGTASATGKIEYSDIMVVEKSKDPGYFVPYVTSEDYELRGVIERLEIPEAENVIKITENDFIQGTYDGRNGNVVSNDYRIRIKDFIQVNAGDVIHFEPDYYHTQGMLCGFVNLMQNIKETAWAYSETDIVAPFAGRLMILIRNSGTNVEITPTEYACKIRIYKQSVITTKTYGNDQIFRCSYAEPIPQPETTTSPYPVSYSAFISKYDEIVSRVNALYNSNSYASNVALPLVATKTELETLTSGKTLYKYEFTPAYYKKTVFIIAGIHGNEYEGTYGLYYMMRMMYGEEYEYPMLKELKANVKFVFIPCVNPDGFEANTKENANGQDIRAWFRPYNPNRPSDPYEDDPNAPKEFLSIKAVTENSTFDYFLDLHSDPNPNDGCYGYALTSVNTETLPHLYNITQIFRNILLEEYNFNSGVKNTTTGSANYGKYIVVGDLGSPITSGGSVGYMYRHCGGCLGNLLEISSHTAQRTGGFAPPGSVDTSRMSVDWYMNVLLTMYKNVFGNES